ncbi:MAG: hypothetical protein JOZ72_06215 [Alphaproteobacteria bacterium]|nr:hypothetical protein [Alphaproteobacteria bacterium]
MYKSAVLILSAALLAGAPAMAGQLPFDNLNQAQTGRMEPGSGVDYQVRSGNGRALIVCVYTLNDTALAPTFNGMPLGFVAKSTYPGVGRLGVAAYLLLDAPEGMYRLVLNGSETATGLILSFSQAAALDASSSAEVQGQTSIMDSVTTTRKNDFLIMCETDSGAGNDAWAHQTVRGSTFLNASGLSIGTRPAPRRGANPLTIIAGNNRPPTAAMADVLMAFRPF